MKNTTTIPPGNPGEVTTEDLGMTFVSIPGGSFEIGCSPNDNDCDSDELPRHTVTVSSFKIGTYEVTQGQWEAVMDSNPSYFSSCGDECPVEEVSWNDVQYFIDALNQQTGKNYRLPTEAEWEYAARAGTTTRYYCGDDESCLDDIAWYSSNSGSKTHPVGQKTPNAWGLYDMSGNVWEWVEDWYSSSYYSSSPSTDPQGTDSGSYRVIRGGSWNRNAKYCRLSCRNGKYPSDGYNNLGFRLCLP